VDNPLDAGEMAKSGFSIPFVGPDNFQGAGQVGNYIHQRLSGNGRAMIIEGIRGVQNAEDRKNGLIQALSKSPGIQIVSLESANWHMDEAMSLIMKTVRQPDSVDAILCANDQMALGALKALDMLDFKKKIWVTGYDNTEGLRYEMTQGRIHATVEQHPEVMGQTGVMLAWNALKGQKIPDKTITPVDLVTFESMNKKLHLSISSLSNPFFSSLVQGALSMSKIFGFQTVVFDAENNDARQLTDMVGSIRTGLDLLIINPTHSESIVSGIELANEKHIPVITVDRKASDADILCHVESDNVGGGRIAASAMIRYLKGNGRIIEMEGIPAASVSHERGMGFNAMIQRHPDIRIVAREVGNFDREDARQAMQRLLQKSIRFDAVFAHNDVMILGVLDALTDAGIDPSTRVLIGFDGIPEVLDQIKQGRLTATVGQKPEVMGSLALQQAARFFRGDDVSSSILVNLELIEKP
ncbi:MAG: substrate-binding domain-containing protein, partial [Desulfatirhabdiaceae bacterium]